jgi:hypothetical protein
LASPAFFVNVASKGVSVPISLLESAFTKWLASVTSKGFRSPQCRLPCRRLSRAGKRKCGNLVAAVRHVRGYSQKRFYADSTIRQWEKTERS